MSTTKSFNITNKKKSLDDSKRANNKSSFFQNQKVSSTFDQNVIEKNKPLLYKLHKTNYKEMPGVSYSDNRKLLYNILNVENTDQENLLIKNLKSQRHKKQAYNVFEAIVSKPISNVKPYSYSGLKASQNFLEMKNGQKIDENDKIFILRKKNRNTVFGEAFKEIEKLKNIGKIVNEQMKELTTIKDLTMGCNEGMSTKEELLDKFSDDEKQRNFFEIPQQNFPKNSNNINEQKYDIKDQDQDQNNLFQPYYNEYRDNGVNHDQQPIQIEKNQQQFSNRNSNTNKIKYNTPLIDIEYNSDKSSSVQTVYDNENVDSHIYESSCKFVGNRGRQFNSTNNNIKGILEIKDSNKDIIQRKSLITNQNDLLAYPIQDRVGPSPAFNYNHYGKRLTNESQNSHKNFSKKNIKLSKKCNLNPVLASNNPDLIQLHEEVSNDGNLMEIGIDQNRVNVNRSEKSIFDNNFLNPRQKISECRNA